MPNRLLKDSICTSEDIDRLTWFEEVFFYRLIVNCDDYGRMDARPKILKAKCFPLKDVAEQHLGKALNKLSTAGLVSLYEVDGRPYLQLTTWAIHQQIRAKKSKFPAPDINCNHLISNDIKCSRNPIQSNTNPNPNIYEPPAGNPYRPDEETVKEYISVKGFRFSVDEFMAYYDAVDWMQHGEPIKNWMSKCVTFEQNHKKWANQKKPEKVEKAPEYIQKQINTGGDIDFESLDKI